MAAQPLVMQTNFLNPQYDSLRDSLRWTKLMADNGRLPARLALIELPLDRAVSRLQR